MTLAEQLEARLKAALFNGAAARRLFQLRQRRPDLAYEIDQIAAGLKDAGDDLLGWIRTLAPPAEPPAQTDAL